MHRVGAVSAPMTRPRGLGPGTPALLAVWCTGLAIAMLTGAAAVVILLAAGAVALAYEALAGAIIVRRARVTSISTDAIVTAGDILRWQVEASTHRAAGIELR